MKNPTQKFIAGIVSLSLVMTPLTGIANPTYAVSGDDVLKIIMEKVKTGNAAVNLMTFAMLEQTITTNKGSIKTRIQNGFNSDSSKGTMVAYGFNATNLTAMAEELMKDSNVALVKQVVDGSTTAATAKPVFAATARKAYELATTDDRGSRTLFHQKYSSLRLPNASIKDAIKVAAVNALGSQYIVATKTIYDGNDAAATYTFGVKRDFYDDVRSNVLSTMKPGEADAVAIADTSVAATRIIVQAVLDELEVAANKATLHPFLFNFLKDSTLGECTVVHRDTKAPVVTSPAADSTPLVTRTATANPPTPQSPMTTIDTLQFALSDMLNGVNNEFPSAKFTLYSNGLYGIEVLNNEKFTFVNTPGPGIILGEFRNSSGEAFGRLYFTVTDASDSTPEVIDLTKKADYKVKLTLQDAEGNSTQIIRTISLIDPAPPTPPGPQPPAPTPQRDRDDRPTTQPTVTLPVDPNPPLSNPNQPGTPGNTGDTVILPTEKLVLGGVKTITPAKAMELMKKLGILKEKPELDKAINLDAFSGKMTKLLGVTIPKGKTATQALAAKGVFKGITLKKDGTLTKAQMGVMVFNIYKNFNTKTALKKVSKDIAFDKALAGKKQADFDKALGKALMDSYKVKKLDTKSNVTERDLAVIFYTFFLK